jgi:hypothetical protein
MYIEVKGYRETTVVGLLRLPSRVADSDPAADA